MKRRIAVLLTGALMAGMLALLPAAPASANADVCGGVGTANTPALQYPIGTYNSGAFNFQLAPGVCVLKPGLTATGTLGGYCGLSSGRGSTDGGHTFYYLGLGGLLLVTGEVTGVVLASPNVVGGHSCTTGASQFIIVGGAVKHHCHVGVDVTIHPVSSWPPVATGGAVIGPCPIPPI